MAFLRASDWRLGDELMRNVRDQSWGGFMVYEVIERSMKLLRRHLEDGSIYGFARELAGEFDPEDCDVPGDGFTESDLARLLKRGEFNYNRTLNLGSQTREADDERPTLGDELSVGDLEFTSRVLEIQDICPPCEPHAGASTTEELWVELNWKEFIVRAKDSPYEHLYPANRVGLDRIAIDMAAVLLHQMLHNQQFTHEENPGETFMYDPEVAYYRSLPNVAQQAVYLVADSYYEGSGDRPSASERWPATCGCVKRVVEPDPLPIVPAAVVDPALLKKFRPDPS